MTPKGDELPRLRPGTRRRCGSSSARKERATGQRESPVRSPRTSARNSRPRFRRFSQSHGHVAPGSRAAGLRRDMGWLGKYPRARARYKRYRDRIRHLRLRRQGPRLIEDGAIVDAVVILV